MTIYTYLIYLVGVFVADMVLCHEHERKGKKLTDGIGVFLILISILSWLVVLLWLVLRLTEVIKEYLAKVIQKHEGRDNHPKG